MKRAEKETTEKLEKLSKHIVTTKKNVEIPEKKKNIQKPTFKTKEVVCLVVLTTLISLILGSLITYNLYIKKIEYSKADSELQTFLKTYEEINENYYETVDKQKLIEGAISGMLESLDDYSAYYNESETNNLDITLEGEYQGLGVEIYNNEELDIIISSVIDDSPASEAGLKAGDILTKYNGKSIKNTTTTDFVKMVKKDNMKNISLSYIRDGKENIVELKQKQITLKSVSSQLYKDTSVGYIRMSVFANNSYKLFKENLEELEKNNIKTLIIDVRSNSGGHLSSAEDIISLFLSKHHPIYQIETKKKTQKYYSKGKKDKNYNIIVLVDSHSASASEILASALKEQYGATLVGQKTYGKGTVQELQTLKNGAKFKLTTKKWLTSKGKQIDKQGIDVDVEVKLTEEYFEDPSEENDTQLQKALELAEK